MNPDEWLDAVSAAAEFGCSPRTVTGLCLRLAAAKDPRVRRLGKPWMIQRGALVEEAERRAREAAGKVKWPAPAAPPHRRPRERLVEMYDRMTR
ncbi:MAG TPA: hypothetical protein VD970_09625 [Acetobacteraceae bacterium]|nr:hypothetical protein [Acetobacteraceae bacterium]